MAAVEVTISGVLYDKQNRTMQQVVLIGEASLTGVGIGGGPMPPGPGKPDHIWGGGNVPMPTPPIANVPGVPGYRPPGTGIWPNPPEGQAPIVSHPIVLPGDPSWEGPGGIKPPDFQPPPPGSPPILVPGGQPVNPITAPPFIVVQYPGMGAVVVPQPVPPPAPAPAA